MSRSNEKPESHDEWLQKLIELASPEVRLRGLTVEERLRGLTAEERLRAFTAEWLRGLTAEERLRGLRQEHVFLAIPDEILRNLSGDFIKSLPSDVQRAIRERLGHHG